MGFVNIYKDKLIKAAGPRQFGVGTSSGAEAVVFTIETAEALYDHTRIVSLDTKAAFQSVKMLHTLLRSIL